MLDFIFAIGQRNYLPGWKLPKRDRDDKVMNRLAADMLELILKQVDINKFDKSYLDKLVDEVQRNRSHMTDLNWYHDKGSYRREHI